MRLVWIKGSCLAFIATTIAGVSSPAVAQTSTALTEVVNVGMSTGFRRGGQSRLILYAQATAPLWQSDTRYTFCSLTLAYLSTDGDAGHVLIESTPSKLRFQYWAFVPASYPFNDGRRAWFQASYDVKFIRPNATQAQRRAERCQPQPSAEPERRWPDEEPEVGGPEWARNNWSEALLHVYCNDRTTGKYIGLTPLRAWAPSCSAARQLIQAENASRDVCTQPNASGTTYAYAVESGITEWMQTFTCTRP
jgi:hypothetical protein